MAYVSLILVSLVSLFLAGCGVRHELRLPQDTTKEQPTKTTPPVTK
jgi:predicted small lipoprotein YifL